MVNSPVAESYESIVTKSLAASSNDVGSKPS